MSTGPNEKGPIPVYSDAEKGTLEVLPPQSPTTTYDEKKAMDLVTVYPLSSVPALKKDAPSPPVGVMRPQKPKKKVSKWILWTIWFNTYR